jgi:MFS transporter, DHA2 family, methylenomycin A resistance protein
MTGLTGLLTLAAPRAATRFGARVPVAFGQAAIAAGLLSLAIAVALQAPVGLIALLTIPVGAGSALAIPTITAVLLSSVPPDGAGTASAA